MRGAIGNPAIRTTAEFHTQIATALSFPDYYGKNLDALWDVLGVDIERPSELIWLHSEVSRTAMLGDFDRIVALFQELQVEDKERGVPAFSLILK